MKALSKKSLILVLSLVFALSALMFAYFFKPVKAETGTIIDGFEVVQAAQVRTGQNDDKGAGLRFKVKMDYTAASFVKEEEGVDNVKLGFLITPKALFDAAVTTAKTEAEEAGSTEEVDITKIDYLTKLVKPDGSLGYVGNDGEGIPINESTIYIADAEDNIRDWKEETGEESYADIANTGESYYANAVIKGVEEFNNQALDFTAIAYIKVVDGENTEYFYVLPEDTTFARNVYDTANTAYWDKANERESIEKAFDWYATKSYPIKINNKAQYEEFAKSTATDKFEGDYLQIAAPIDLGAGNGSELKVVSSNFAGTLSKASGATLVYENTANVGEAPVLAEEGSAAASVLASMVKLYDFNKLSMTPSEENVEQCFDSTTSRGTQSFVAKAALDELDVTNDSNWSGYDGDAYLYDNLANDNIAKITLNYTAKEYELFAEKGKFNAVKFSFMIDTPNASNTKINGDTLLGKTTYHIIHGDNIKSDWWYTTVVSAKDFISAMSGSTLDFAKSLAVNSADRKAFDLYMGNIEMLSDFNLDTYVSYRGDYNFIVSEDNYTKFKESADAVFPITYHAYADLPTKHTMTSNTDPSVTTEVSIVNDYYTGNAVSCTDLKRNINTFISLNYTPEEYRKMAAAGKFNAVRFNFMVNHNLMDVKVSCLSTATPSLINQSSLGTKALTQNTWQSVTLSIDAFVNTYYNSTYGYRVYRPETTGKLQGANIYLGNIEFITITE